MSTYAIGDIQGCYDALMRLLEHIAYDDSHDRLWFVGDLVNRGPQSLEVLRLIRSLKSTPKITLGNHDLHLLGLIYSQNPWRGKDDTLVSILESDDKFDIAQWLRNQSILVWDESHNITMTHAGIPPCWDLSEAQSYARELESVLKGADHIAYFEHMYGNTPNVWQSSLAGFDRLRLITNYFTRMRFLDAEGSLLLDYKGTIQDAPQGYVPWFLNPKRKRISTELVFGHWAALEGKCPIDGIYAIDTGCLWGNALTALRLEDRRRFSVPASEF